MALLAQDVRIRPVPEELRCMARELREIMGTRRASEILGVSRNVLTRICARGTVMPGTLALLREAEARIRTELKRVG